MVTLPAEGQRERLCARGRAYHRTVKGSPEASSEGVRRSMKSNRSADTRPERRLRSALHRRGLRFRKNFVISASGLKVRADVAFPGRRVAIFLDGCFWHCCPDHGTRPKANSSFWTEKLDGNVKRDAAVTEALTDEGWLVFRVWEHEDPEEAAGAIDATIAVIRIRWAGPLG